VIDSVRTEFPVLDAQKELFSERGPARRALMRPPRRSRILGNAESRKEFL